MNSFCINNTNISRLIRTGVPLNYWVSAAAVKDQGRKIESEFILKPSADEAKEIVREKITYLDMAIADAVYSLFLTDQTTFSEGMILRALSGDDDQTCREETKKRIRASLEKMAGLRISLKCDDEMRVRRVTDFDSMDDEPFLALKKLRNGKYEMTAPPVYRYAEKVKQIVSIPMKLWCLDHKKPVNDSLENIAIKHYLLHRIAIANNEKNRQLGNFRKIYYYRRTHDAPEEGETPFSGMLFDLNIVNAWEKKNGQKLRELENGDTEAIRSELSKLKNRTHKNTVKILEALKEKEIGYIGGYDLIKGAGKEIIGVEITGAVKALETYRETPKKNK